MSWTRHAWVVLLAACATPSVSLSVGLPSSVVDQTAWIEIGAFPSACPTPEQLAGGLPETGFTERVAYRRDDPPLPLGNVAATRYGFAAVARSDTCGVVAAGCTTADVSGARVVNVTMDPTSDPDAGACSAGLVCDFARCVPPAGGGDPAAGAGCSMKLVGAGPLPDPLFGNPLVTAPAIVPTANGFLIGYAEYLDFDGTVRVTLQPIDQSGGAPLAQQQALDGHCAGQAKIDAAGLAMGTTGGLFVMSRPPCQGQSGVELLPLDATGVVQKRNVFLNSTAPEIVLSTHSLSSAAAAGQHLLAASVSGGATLDSTNGASVSTQVTTSFSTSQDTAVRVVRGSKALAVEADGPSVGDAGVTGPVARVYLSSAGSDPTNLGGPVDQVQATVTALAVLGGRAFLLSDGADQGEAVSFRGYDLGSAQVPAVTGGMSGLKQTSALAVDAAAAQNRLFVAFEQQDSLAVAVIDAASSSGPVLLRRVDFVADSRIPNTAHDGPVAVAATSSEVAVTWVAHKGALSDGEAVGGYAVFACSP